MSIIFKGKYLLMRTLYFLLHFLCAGFLFAQDFIINPYTQISYHHNLPLLQRELKISSDDMPYPIGISFIYNYAIENYRIKKFAITPGPLLSPILGKGEQNWKLSKGITQMKTHSIGAKVDVLLFPFLQLFGMATYLKVQQSIQMGEATVPNIFNKPITLAMPDMMNNLEGFMAMGGANLIMAYKGFVCFVSAAGGYVRLDNKEKEIYNFVSQPIFYVAPRLGYSYNGIFTAYTGVQYLKTFGKNQGQGLVNMSDKLVKSYSVEVEKFPVNFLVGIQWMLNKNFGLTMEYSGSPDNQAFMIEAGLRF